MRRCRAAQSDAAVLGGAAARTKPMQLLHDLLFAQLFAAGPAHYPPLPIDGQRRRRSVTLDQIDDFRAARVPLEQRRSSRSPATSTASSSRCGDRRQRARSAGRADATSSSRDSAPADDRERRDSGVGLAGPVRRSPTSARQPRWTSSRTISFAHEPASCRALRSSKESRRRRQRAVHHAATIPAS